MKKKFFESRFLIAGIVRNCEKVLKKQINVINNAFSNAASAEWFIVESDSDDKTLKELESISFDINLKYISLGVLRNKYPVRCERLSICRNYYLNEINNNTNYDHIDYVVVADLDGINTKLNQLSLQSCWEQKVNWDACFANQTAPYYDIRALRHKIWSPNDCYENSRFLIKNGMDRYSAEAITVWSRMIRIDTMHQPIEVDSAFGGLGIYKKKILKDCKYNGGLNKEYNEIVEHVSLNMQIKNKGYKLYIFPSLINGGWNEHNIQLKFYNKIGKKFRQYIDTFLKIFLPEKKLKTLINVIKKLLKN